MIKYKNFYNENFFLTQFLHTIFSCACIFSTAHLSASNEIVFFLYKNWFDIYLIFAKALSTLNILLF